MLDTQSNPAVEEKRESALWLPIASHSVSMGVHLGSLLFPRQDNHV